MINIAHHLVNENEKEEVAVITQPPSAETLKVIEMLRDIPGMMAADKKDFKLATPYFRLKDDTLVKLYENKLNVLHIFLADKTGEKFIYGGYTLLGKKQLKSVIGEIQQQYSKGEKTQGFKWL